MADGSIEREIHVDAEPPRRFAFRRDDAAGVMPGPSNVLGAYGARLVSSP
jgi:hypothetical protein